MEEQRIIEIEIDLSAESKPDPVAPPVVDITDDREKSGIKKMSEQELLEKEKELLGNEFILPTLEEANIMFQLGEEVGPLDVLLELIKETKLDIMEVHLADLTEQFLNYMEAQELNMEQKSEFVSVAATLLEIKSKNLLPAEESEDEEEEEDPEVALKRQLQLYKIFKEASTELALKENIDHFYKEPDKSAGDYRMVLKNMDMQGLVNAFSKLLVKIDKKEKQHEQKQISKDRFTLADSITHMRDFVGEKKKVKFTDCFKQDYSKGEVIITFLAMLELLKRKFIRVKQDDVFEEIEIELREEIKEEEDGNTDAE